MFVCRIIEFYKEIDGFYKVMEFFWVLITYKLNIVNSYFIYVVCKINIRHKKNMIGKVKIFYNRPDFSVLRRRV
ncbi:hypothetical protein RIR_jg8516.t1 [Rhizophagus irregularis DAOM 181602=DAOM 197198]|uniref:Uncharacterized protein n=1 Tax=Rhizophagus irregularis (strain DAOM 181602 / DAOM 197198 / MUCL 43194) TaxID=747089 RepID=U9TWF0_RHIID|nr:hypothetical protein RIR_jg8516.t1 [Rhizophagus irregularis DAOM 181602=DAOM 197198]